MEYDLDKFVALGWQLGAILLILVIGFIFFQIIRRSLESMLNKGIISQPFFLILKNSIRWLLVFAVIVASLQQAGIKITNILTAVLTIAGMIAIGFIAVWSILSNILCSMMLVIFRNFDIGDEVEIVEPVGGTGLKGEVIGFNIMFTTLSEKIDNDDAAMLTQVPNNIFFQKSLRRKPGKKTQRLGQHLLAQPILAAKNGNTE